MDVAYDAIEDLMVDGILDALMRYIIWKESAFVAA